MRSFVGASSLLLLLCISSSALELLPSYVSRIREAQQPQYDSKWAVHLEAGQSPRDLEELGFDIVGKIANLDNIYEIRHRETHARINAGVPKNISSPYITDALLSHPYVKWAEQQYIRPQTKRVTFTDPLYNDQWHLKNTGQFSGVSGVDVNIQSAWDKGYTGTDVQIAIVDDGFQYTHPDLSPRFSAADSHNYNNGASNDPAPDLSKDNNHGSAAAGVALAAANSVCGVGAAYMAKSAGIRLIAQGVSDATEAEGLSFKSQNNHIYSNSWGPADYGTDTAPMGNTLKAAMANNVATGRGGKGNIYVWAAGNGGANRDNCNYDGYANSRYVIAIGAIGNTGKQSYYSENCAALIVSAPSNGGASNGGIRTTDLLGGYGYDSTDCTSTFGGTSSACPLVAGITALVLQANPNLGWRDVQFILATTAKKIDATDSDWVNNAAGYHVNHKYGFGIVDATAAVDAALAYTTNLPAELSATNKITATQTVSPSTPAGITSSIAIATDMVVESVTVTVKIDHAYSGDLKITVTSPQGTQSVLSDVHGYFPTIDVGATSVQGGTAAFGPSTTFEGFSGTIVAPTPADACATITNCGSLNGKIAYIRLSSCEFDAAAKRAQDCGAGAVIFWDPNSSHGEDIYTIPGSLALTIPSLYMSYSDQTANSPAGKAGKVYSKRTAQNGYNDPDWTFTTKRHLGESASGNWVVKVANPVPFTTGTWYSTTVTVFGHLGTTPVATSTTAASGATTTTGKVATTATTGATPATTSKTTSATSSPEPSGTTTTTGAENSHGAIVFPSALLALAVLYALVN